MDGEHCLAFDDLYGKVQTTEKDCPSLSVKASQNKKDSSNFRFISSHIVAVLECSLGGKVCCVYSQNSIITVNRKRELNDIIFFCGTILNSNCASPVENIHHSSMITLTKEAIGESSDEVFL